jgi:hypothetical protein
MQIPRKPRTSLRSSLWAFLLLLVAAVLLLPSCTKREDRAASARVLVMTASEASSPQEFAGAEALLRALPAGGSQAHPSGGAGAAGGLEGVIQRSILPDTRGPAGEAAVAASIAQAAADPKIKAIVVDPALPGTAEGFRRAKSARPQLLCIAGESREDELELEASADLVVDLDRVYRAYLIPWAAKKMGAKALLAFQARAGEDDDSQNRERAIMAAACADLGLKYVEYAAPAGADPIAYARAMTGAWLKDLGRDTDLYCSDPRLTPGLIAGALAGGAILADSAGAATRAAYAAALGLDLSPAKGDAKRERSLIEASLMLVGGRGRFGLWEADYGCASVEGLGEFASEVALGTATKDDLKALVKALDSRSSDSAWLAAYDTDPDTGVAASNHILLRQDIYVLGSGYLQSALQLVPSKYLRIGASQSALPSPKK